MAVEDKDDTQDQGSAGDGKSTDASGTGTESSDTGTSDSAAQEGTESLSPTEVAALRAQVAEANREAAKFRKERNTAKSELDKAKEAELSDLEREKKRADQAETNLSTTMARIREANLKVALAESPVGIVDIESATLLLNKRGLEFDDEGAPQDISDAIKSLVRDKPFLVGRSGSRSQGDTNAGAGNTDENGGVSLSADELMVARAFRMTPEDYAKYKNTTST